MLAEALLARIRAKCFHEVESDLTPHGAVHVAGSNPISRSIP
jgi:hypothetical protein